MLPRALLSTIQRVVHDASDRKTSPYRRTRGETCFLVRSTRTQPEATDRNRQSPLRVHSNTLKIAVLLPGAQSTAPLALGVGHYQGALAQGLQSELRQFATHSSVVVPLGARRVTSSPAAPRRLAATRDVQLRIDGTHATRRRAARHPMRRGDEPQRGRLPNAGRGMWGGGSMQAAKVLYCGVAARCTELLLKKVIMN